MTPVFKSPELRECQAQLLVGCDSDELGPFGSPQHMTWVLVLERLLSLEWILPQLRSKRLCHPELVATLAHDDGGQNLSSASL